MIIDKPYYEDNTRISNSAIGWFLKKGPRFYRDMIDGKEEGLKLPQLERGTMIHEYILQPEEFWNDYIILDYEVPKVKQQKDFCETYANSLELIEDDKKIAAYNERADEIKSKYKPEVALSEIKSNIWPQAAGLLWSEKESAKQKIADVYEDILEDIQRWTLRPIKSETLTLLHSIHDFKVPLTINELKMIETEVTGNLIASKIFSVSIFDLGSYPKFIKHGLLNWKIRR